MIEPDTIKLLRECDAGIKMGIQAIDDVFDHVQSPDFKQLLHACKEEHGKLAKEIEQLLNQYHDDGKDPNFITEKMAKIKTEIKLQMNATDNTIADLVTNGCNIGVKSLNKYLNQYAAAEEKSKDITKRLINLEGQLVLDIRKFL